MSARCVSNYYRLIIAEHQKRDGNKVNKDTNDQIRGRYQMILAFQDTILEVTY